MAKIWKVKDGPEPTTGGPWLERTLHDCEEKLGLRRTDFLKALPSGPSDRPAGPRFGAQEDLGAMFRDYARIVVEIDDVEAKRHGWKSGYDLAPVSPKDAERSLTGRGTCLYTVPDR